MKWWHRSSVQYGLAAGILLGSTLGGGYLLIKLQAPQWESIPPDAPADRQWNRPSIVTDPFTTVETKKTPDPKSSSGEETSQPGVIEPLAPANTPAPVRGTPAAPEPKPPAVKPTSVPIPAPVPSPTSTRLPVLHIPIPLLPGVKVTVPKVLGLSTEG